MQCKKRTWHWENFDDESPDHLSAMIMLWIHSEKMLNVAVSLYLIPNVRQIFVQFHYSWTMNEQALSEVNWQFPENLPVLHSAGSLIACFGSSVRMAAVSSIQLSILFEYGDASSWTTLLSHLKHQMGSKCCAVHATDRWGLKLTTLFVSR